MDGCFCAVLFISITLSIFIIYSNFEHDFFFGKHLHLKIFAKMDLIWSALVMAATCNITKKGPYLRIFQFKFRETF